MKFEFEKFVDLVKKDFGLTVVKTESNELLTMENLFGPILEALKNDGYYKCDNVSLNPIEYNTNVTSDKCYIASNPEDFESFAFYECTQDCCFSVTANIAA